MDWQKKYKPQRKADIGDIAQAVRDSVSMEDAISLYAPGYTPRGKRIPCPLHHGKDLNFSFTAKYYKCFVCGASGDVISFVQEVCGLPTRVDAIKRLNADMGLGLPLDGADEDDAFREKIRQRRYDAERRQQHRTAWENQYRALMDEWCALDRVRMSSDDPEDVALAIKRMTIVEYFIDSLPEEPR